MAQRLLLNIRANFAQRAAGGAVGVDSGTGTGSGDGLLLGGGGGGGDGFTFSALSAMEFEGVFDALGTMGSGTEMGTGGVGSMGTVVEEGGDMNMKEYPKNEKGVGCVPSSPISGGKGKQSMDGEKQGSGFEDKSNIDIEAQRGFDTDIGTTMPMGIAMNAITVGGRRERGMSDLSGSTAVYSPTTTAHTRSPTTATGADEQHAGHWHSASGGGGGGASGSGSGSGSNRSNYHEEVGTGSDEIQNREDEGDDEGGRRVRRGSASASESVYASAVSSPTSTFAMSSSPISISDSDPTSSFFPYVAATLPQAAATTTTPTSPESNSRFGFPFSSTTTTSTDSLDAPFRTPLADLSEQDVSPVEAASSSHPPRSSPLSLPPSPPLSSSTSASAPDVSESYASPIPSTSPPPSPPAPRIPIPHEEIEGTTEDVRNDTSLSTPPDVPALTHRYSYTSANAGANAPRSTHPSSICH